MSKTPLIFVGSIAAAVIITILGTMFIEPQAGFEPTTEEISTPLGTFYQPRDVAVNGSGNIFVADTINSRIQVFNADGAFNYTFAFAGNSATDGSLNQPFGISINSTGHVHVADTFTHVIKVFSPGGDYLKTIGTAGTASGEYYRPSGITTNGTNIFIADTFNNRIQITDLSGNTVDTIP